uniref:MATH domain-containing protein n=1 Tax=Mesocestoides corti TaxID=53468 RepID=A0A5K3EP82_MESCO
MEEAENEPLMCCKPPPVDHTVEAAAVADEKLGTTLVLEESSAALSHCSTTTSCGRGWDFRLRGFKWAFNVDPGTEPISSRVVHLYYRAAERTNERTARRGPDQFVTRL